MDNSSKYKRWGWGAVIGLAGVLVVAGLVIAATMASSKPKAGDEPTPEVATEVQVEPEKENNPEEEKTPVEEPVETPVYEGGIEEKPVEEKHSLIEEPKVEIPTTGPEDIVLPVVVLAVCAYLIALNISYAKKQA